LSAIHNWNDRLRSKARGTFYGWWLVPIGGVIHSVTSVPLFHAMGLWFVALEDAFGWNRTQLSLAFSLTRVEGGIMGPVEGYLTDRLGPRRIIFIGLLVLGCGFLFLSQVQNLWMFYIAFIIMALGQGMGGWLPMNTLLNNWFVRNRATAMGISSAISRLGALILIPAMAWAVDPDEDNLGWRMTAVILAVMAFSLAIPITKVIRNRPEDMGLRTDGDPAEEESASDVTLTADDSEQGTADSVPVVPEGDFTLKQAMRTSSFWLIAFGHGFTSMIIISIMAHLAPLLTLDRGYSVPTAGLVVTAYTAVSMIFQIIGGYVGDRMPKRIALFVFSSIQAGAIFILIFAPNLGYIFLFAVVFGMGFGGRNPLTTSIRGDYFGRSSFGKIMGMTQLPMNVLLLIAPIFAGYMRDTYGTYDVAFITLAGFNFLGGVLLLMAKKPTLPSNPASPASPDPRRAPDKAD
jgi:MFS family permease